MGLIVDTSVLITAERKRIPVEILLERLTVNARDQVFLSIVSVVELTHGIHRAKSEAERIRRRGFLEEVLQIIGTAPMDLAIARLSGRIEGEQAAIGNVIAFQDLIIGSTALHLGSEVATYNVRHFERIPGVRIIVPAL